MTHTLTIHELRPGTASCSCGGWAYISSLPASRERIEEEHHQHVLNETIQPPQYIPAAQRGKP